MLLLEHYQIYFLTFKITSAKESLFLWWILTPFCFKTFLLSRIIAFKVIIVSVLGTKKHFVERCNHLCQLRSQLNFLFFDQSLHCFRSVVKQPPPALLYLYVYILIVNVSKFLRHVLVSYWILRAYKFLQSVFVCYWKILFKQGHTHLTILKNAYDLAKYLHITF